MDAETVARLFPIETERLRLRLFRATDGDDFHAFYSDERTLAFKAPRDTSAEISREHLAFLLTEQESKALGINVAVERLDDGRVIGTAVLIPDSHNGAEIGYMLGSAYWGCGYAREAAKALVDEAFVKLGLNRVWATSQSANEKSVAILEFLKMEREGTLREYEESGGVGDWVDVDLYALLRREWRAGRGRLA